MTWVYKIATLFIYNCTSIARLKFLNQYLALLDLCFWLYLTMYSSISQLLLVWSHINIASLGRSVEWLTQIFRFIPTSVAYKLFIRACVAWINLLIWTRKYLLNYGIKAHVMRLSIAVVVVFMWLDKIRLFFYFLTAVISISLKLHL